jgi:hypothetical protein
MTGMLAFTTMQPIVGVDMHVSLPPIPPVILPHPVVWGTGLSLAMGLPLSISASKAMSSDHPQAAAKGPVAVGFGHAVGRGHDAGPHVGHIAGNTLLAIIWLGAASKAEFGSGTVLVQGQQMAVNMMMVMNPQLQCSDPIPMPSGLSFATGSNMVFANFTWLDLLAGIVHMLVDIIISAIINLCLGALTKFVGGQIARLFSGGPGMGLMAAFRAQGTEMLEAMDDIFLRRLTASTGGRVMDWSRLTPRGFANQMGAVGNNLRDSDFVSDVLPGELAGSARDTAASLLAGGPTGADLPPPGLEEAPGSTAGNAANNGVDSLLY